MNINPPLNEAPGQSLTDTWRSWSQGWSSFFTQLFQAVGWLKSWAYKFEHDFPSVSANSQSAGYAVPITGVRQGDSVQVTPYSETTGLTYKGVVTSDDVVTIYAINFTTGAIDPASMDYRVVVIQN